MLEKVYKEKLQRFRSRKKVLLNANISKILNSGEAAGSLCLKAELSLPQM